MVEKNNSYLQKLPEGLAKTGFLLEHEVTEAFRSSGWGVINNRFYVDDVDGRARELDLVIYKVSTGKDIDVVTSLLISCKKNEQAAFVFMSREKFKLDPNIDWQPIHHWTMQEPLNTHLENSNWKDTYITSDAKLHSDIFNIQRHAFATQLISKANGSPQNDKVIFESIAGLMKALDHEILALPSRMKKQRLYTFNLITVVDAPIVDAQFSGSEIQPKEIKDFKYLARYIVRKRELTARIHFVMKSELTSLVKQYTQLAAHDLKFFSAQVTASYKAITTSSAIQRYFAKRLSPAFKWRINYALRQGRHTELDDEIEFTYDVKKKELLIGLSVTKDAVDYLMKNTALINAIRDLLRENVRYEGAFRLDELIPF